MKLVKLLKETGGISDNVGDGLIPGVNFDVTQGVASFAHLNDNAFFTVRSKRWKIVTATGAFVAF